MKFLFCLKRTVTAIPVFMIRPERSAPNGREPMQYILVKITLDAQFGISPMTIARRGVKALAPLRKADILSSPIKCTRVLKARLITKIKAKI